MPYISASIVVQLMGIAIPYLQKLQKEGASGQKKITQITTLVNYWIICLFQAPGYLASITTSCLVFLHSAFIIRYWTLANMSFTFLL
jgi:preprotein translocase subunit SecY